MAGQASSYAGRYLFNRFIGNSLRQVGTDFGQGFLGGLFEDGANKGIEKVNTEYGTSMPKFKSAPPSSVPELAGGVSYTYLKQNTTYVHAKTTQMSLGSQNTSEGLNTFVSSMERFGDHF
jgi:hypothetical protein